MIWMVRSMAEGEGLHMDDSLYKAATGGRQCHIPSVGDDNDGLFYLRLTPGDQSNALHVAAQHGNHEFIREILCRVNPAVHQEFLCKRNSRGENPLHLAARSGSKETVEALLGAHDQNKLSVLGGWRERDNQDDTPLHIALRYGHDKIGLLMLERDLQYLVSLDNHVGESLAYLAAQNFCTNFLHRILEADRLGLCSVSFSGPFGQTPFHPARKLTGDIMRILIERRKHLMKVQDNKGKTVLHYAVEEESDPGVKILLEADNTLAYLHDQDGLTPLHIAASRGFLRMIRTILELCPQSIRIRDKHHGQTALHKLKMDASFLNECLQNTRMEELINEVDKDGNTPLHLALQNSDIATADRLLQVDGINWRLTNKQGCSPMDLCTSDDQIPSKLKRMAAAGRRDNEEVNMEILFPEEVIHIDKALRAHYYRAGERLESEGLQQGDSIFHIAARDGNLKAINRVQELPSDHPAQALLFTGQNSKGETPLHLAAEHGHLEVVRSILRKWYSQSYVDSIPESEEITSPFGEEGFPRGDPGNSEMPWRIKSANGDTPAHKALRNKHDQVACHLLVWDSTLISINNKAKESLLYLAADSCCYASLGRIMSLTADKGRYSYYVNASGRGGQNFLHAAARCPRFFERYWTWLIEDRPCLLQEVDECGKNPLHYAVEEKRWKIAQWMLVRDKSMAVMYDNEGFTPLLRAAICGGAKCINVILDLCPESAEFRDLRSNKTVLHLAKFPRFYLQKCVKHEVMVKLINETDKDGNTPLHCAILDGEIDKALLLLETRGIDWKIRNKQHQLPSEISKQLITSGKTEQRSILIALESVAMVGYLQRFHPRQAKLVSSIKYMLLAYNEKVLTDENMKKMLDNIAVAAALLVTITFAAAFTIPGGYDQNTGELMLMKQAAVRVFIGSDVLAMLMAFSILVRYTVGVGRRAKLRKLAVDSIIMLQISLAATLLAFVSGVYAIGFNVKSVFFVPIAVAALLNLGLLSIPEFI